MLWHCESSARTTGALQMRPQMHPQMRPQMRPQIKGI